MKALDRIWTWVVGLALMLAVFGLLAAVAQGVKGWISDNATDWYAMAWSALPRIRDVKLILGCVLLVWLLSPHLKRVDRLMTNLERFLDDKNKPNA
jgi:hypothetical protein